jgi:hypothetical protein
MEPERQGKNIKEAWIVSASHAEPSRLIHFRDEPTRHRRQLSSLSPARSGIHTGRQNRRPQNSVLKKQRCCRLSPKMTTATLPKTTGSVVSHRASAISEIAQC